MKAEINFNEEMNCINVLITDSNRTLEDLEETGRNVAQMQQKFGINKVFYDHSHHKWNFDYVSEYSIAKNLDNLLPFEPNTKVAFYLGKFYNERYWKLMKEIIIKNSSINLKYFGNYDEAKKWLSSD